MMFKTKSRKFSKKRIIVIIAAALLVTAGAAFTIITVNGKKDDSEQVISKETQVERGNLVVGVIESGNVTIGSVTQDYELDLSTDTASSSGSSTGSSSGSSSSSQSGQSSASQMGSIPGMQVSISSSGGSTSASGSSSGSSSSSQTAELTVEEIYVSPGQVISEGDNVLKLTDSSVSDARTLLKEQIAGAELALKQAKYEKKSTKLEADYEYESNIANGNTAKEKYNATISSLKNAVSKAKKALSDADDKIKELPVQIKALEKTIKAGSKTTSESGSSNVSGSTSVSGNSSVTGSTSSSDTSDSQKKLEELERELEETKSGYDSLETALENAQREYKTGKVTAKQEYDESLLNYDNASELYNIATNSLDSDVEDAEAALEDARTQLEDFEDFVGEDGTVKADSTGTVVSVGYAAGDSLSEDTSIVTYQDENSVTLSVSVTQEDVAKISVGDSVQMVFTAYEDETWQGKVESIASTESSSSTVTYDVVCTVEGDVSKLYEGMSGTVTFVTKEVNDVLYVSNKAVLTEGTKTYVMKGDGDNKVRTEVKTGFSDGTNVEITEGLAEGDTVYIESQVNS